MGKRSEMDAAQRQEAVLALIRREATGEEIARRYGVSTNTLYAWRDVYLQSGQAALANGRGKGDVRDRRILELQEELAERDRVIGELTIANRILKKTAPRGPSIR